jgi:hypothetical protein
MRHVGPQTPCSRTRRITKLRPLGAHDEGYDPLQFAEMDDVDRQIPIIDDADDPGLTIVSDDAKMVRDDTSYADDLYAVVADKLDIGLRGLGPQGWPHAASDSTTDS